MSPERPLGPGAIPQGWGHQAQLHSCPAPRSPPCPCGAAPQPQPPIWGCWDPFLSLPSSHPGRPHPRKPTTTAPCSKPPPCAWAPAPPVTSTCPSGTCCPWCTPTTSSSTVGGTRGGPHGEVGHPERLGHPVSPRLGHLLAEPGGGHEAGGGAGVAAAGAALAAHGEDEAPTFHLHPRIHRRQPGGAGGQRPAGLHGRAGPGRAGQGRGQGPWGRCHRSDASPPPRPCPRWSRSAGTSETSRRAAGWTKSSSCGRPTRRGSVTSCRGSTTPPTTC